MSQKTYLPNLNGLRAIAALIVAVYHFDSQLSHKIGITNFNIYDSNISASLAVTLFFVLSGYLITYLLLLEDNNNLKSIYNFYFRRIYRIWPLYYMVILLTMIGNLYLFGNIFSLPDTFFYLSSYSFFTGNFLNLSTIPYYLTPLIVLWSVGVEEQFYLIWPWIIKRVKHQTYFIIAIIVISVSLRFFASYTDSNQLLGILYNTRIDCMAIGAIGAFFMLKYDYAQDIIDKYLKNPVTQIIIWLIFLSAFIPGFDIHIFSVINPDFYSLFFLLIIITISHTKTTFKLFENKVFNLLGNISYGIYMYHLLIGYFITLIIKKNNLIFSSSIFSYTTSLTVFLLLTISLSYLSYISLEKYFLLKKKKHT